jgi:hypothetical protein
MIRPSGLIAPALLVLALGSAALADIQVNTFTTGDQRLPAVARAGNGNFIVVWESNDQDGHYAGVFGRRFDSAGAPLGGEFQVNTYTTNSQGYPSVAADAEGNFVVVWQTIYQEDYSYGLAGRLFDSAGNPVGGEFAVASYTTDEQWRPAVGVAPGGDFVVTWNGYGPGPGYFGIWARRFDASATPLGPQFQVNAASGPSSGHYYVAPVAMAADGHFVVVWKDAGIFARRFDAAGVALDPNDVPVSTPEFTTRSPEVAAGADGAFVVTWRAYGDGDGCCMGIFVRRFDSAGTPLAPQFQANTYTPGYQWGPQVGLAPDGDFVVVWTDDSQEEPGDPNYGVFGQRFDATGTPVGGEFHANTFTLGHQGGGYHGEGSGVAAGTDGTFFVVWQSGYYGDQDGDGYGIFASHVTITTTTSTTSTTNTTLPPGQPVSGAKLLVTDTGAPTRRRITFRTTDAAIDTSAATGIDPVADGAFLHIYNASGGSDAVCLPLPAGNWSARGNPATPTYRYTDRTFAAGPCRGGVARHGTRLRIACTAMTQPIGYTLDEPSQGSIAVRFRSGTHDYCTVFGGTIVRDAHNDRFDAKNAPAPVVCPPPPGPCP